MENQAIFDGEFSLYLRHESLDVCGFEYQIVKVGETKMGSADVLVFQQSALKLMAPRKQPHHLWVLYVEQELNEHAYSDMKRHRSNGLIDVVVVLPPGGRMIGLPTLFLPRINSQLPENIRPVDFKSVEPSLTITR